MDTSKTTIAFSLPFCLYKVDERFFNIGDDHNTQTRFTKHKIEPSRRTAASHNVEFLRDRWGIDGFSSIEMKTDKELLEIGEAMDFTLSIVNSFLKLYRYFDEDAVHIFNVTRDDLFDFSVRRGKHITTAIGFGGGLTKIDPIKISDISNKIQVAFDQKIQMPLWQELLMNAQYYSFIGEYRMTILETIIALELILSDFIRTQCKNKGIPDDDAEKYISDVGLTGNIKVSVRLFLDSEKLPDDSIFKKCKSGITIRNAIMHKGRTLVSEQEARDTFDVTIKIIKALNYNLAIN